MKVINIFSDSWYWSWGHSLKSRPGQKNLNLPIIKEFLEFKGYEAIPYAYPGSSFSRIVNQYLDKRSELYVIPKGDISVIFFSGMVRRREDDNPVSRDWLNYCHDYELFNRWYDIEVAKFLDKVEVWAKEHNQKVIIAGGHTRFDAKYIKGRKNFFLLTEDIIESLVLMYHPWKKSDIPLYGRFKLCGDIIDHKIETWHPDLLSEVHRDLNDFETCTIAKLFMWPDTGHLNVQSYYYLVDWLVDFIEKKL